MENSKKAILNNTHYGLNIYSHVLRQYYPGEYAAGDSMAAVENNPDNYQAILSLSGRDCQPTRNPFNSDKPTLKIQVVNNCAEHYDLENSIAKGNVFDFAALHYNLEGEDLCKKLVKLHNVSIAKPGSLCSNPPPDIVTPQPQPVKIHVPVFSYFKAPVTNTIPHKEINLLQVYHLLKGNEFAECTNTLRSIADKQEARKYKAAQFDYVTFSGTFSKRNDKSLLRHSGLITVDFDHIADIPGLKARLLQDEYFETELLFVSPSGDGLKWVIPIDLTKAKQQDFFKAVANYIRHTYQLEVDQSGKDVSRACFLPLDATAFINPKYL